MIEAHDVDVAVAPGTVKPTVLLAEDSTVQRNQIAALLEKNGYQVDEASDGAEALRHLKLMDHQPAVVLADVGMPRMNGINLCRQIRSDPLTRQIPIMLLTVLDDDRNHATAMHAGADEFLTKPVTERELVIRLEKLLKATRARTLDQTEWYRQLFEALPDAILVTNEKGRIIEANGATTTLLGYHRDGLLTLQTKALIFHSNEWVDTQLARVKETGAWQGRLPLKHKNGSQVEVDARVTDAQLSREPVQMWSLRPRLGGASG